MNLFKGEEISNTAVELVSWAVAYIKQLSKLDEFERIEAGNRIKLALHSVSPLSHEPVDCVLWAQSSDVVANDYNPNSVAPPEMKLLQVSIEQDGFTQPIVTFNEGNKLEVIDGFHRNRVSRECKVVRKRLMGYIPVVVINGDRTDRGDRIASTIRHNRARGKHQVSAMSDIVLELKRRNWSDKKIGHDLGMDQDEVLRLTQITGLAEMFKDREFSEAWEAEKITDLDTLNTDQEIQPVSE